MYRWFYKSLIFFVTLVSSIPENELYGSPKCIDSGTCQNTHHNLQKIKSENPTVMTIGTQMEKQQKNKGMNNEDDSSSRLMAVPKYPSEPPALSNILDYILVKWLFPLDLIITTREGRSVLRRYAKEALELLMCAFYRNDRESFRMLIRSLWIRRAHKFFDINGISGLFSYLPYFYTSDLSISQPHTTRSLHNLYLELFHNCKPRPWNERNPPVSFENYNKILNIHLPDNVNYNYQYDIFSEYTKRGMKSAEFHFEKYNDQFYRVLFFILELQARGLITDEDDTYNGPLPSNLVPKEIQAILYDDDLYSKYLLRLKKVYGNRKGDRIRQSIATNARVREEDLIALLVMERPKNHIFFMTTTNRTLSTTAKTSSAMTSITNDIVLDNKDETDKLYLSHCKKRFSKQSLTFPKSCCFHKNSNSSNLNELTESCLKQQYNYTVTSPNDIIFLTCSILRKTYKQY